MKCFDDCFRNNSNLSELSNKISFATQKLSFPTSFSIAAFCTIYRQRFEPIMHDLSAQIIATAWNLIVWCIQLDVVCVGVSFSWTMTIEQFYSSCPCHIYISIQPAPLFRGESIDLCTVNIRRGHADGAIIITKLIKQSFVVALNFIHRRVGWERELNSSMDRCSHLNVYCLSAVVTRH